MRITLILLYCQLPQPPKRFAPGHQPIGGIMNPSHLRKTVAIIATLCAAAALAQNTVAPAPADGGATTIYRQVLPDGRVIYSDKAVKGGKVKAIKVEPRSKSNSWSTTPAAPPAKPAKNAATPIKKTPASSPAQKKTLDEAEAEVARAQLLLDEAKKEQQEGAEPLPGERTGTAAGGSRLNESYDARQKLLEKSVGNAEAGLKKAVADRDALQR
jgi:hypothetical protein